MAVVNNIKEIREQRGIHQNDLAKATGYCTKTIGRIERGESGEYPKVCVNLQTDVR